MVCCLGSAPTPLARPSAAPVPDPLTGRVGRQTCPGGDHAEILRLWAAAVALLALVRFAQEVVDKLMP